MKAAIKVLFALLLFCEGGQAQGFVNLNFENATVTLIPSSSYNVYASNAIPGWTAYLGGDPQGIIGYDKALTLHCLLSGFFASVRWHVFR